MQVRVVSGVTRVMLWPLAVAAQAACSDSGGVTQAAALLGDAAEAGAFHGIALVTRDDDSVFAYRTGTANTGSNRAFDLDTRFQIASLTKLFTDAIVLQLAAAGVLDLDAPIRRYLPDLSAHIGAQVATRHLIDGSSGLPRELRPDDAEAGADVDARGMVVLGDLAHVTFEYAPGTRSSYSNLAYWVLGAIVESTTGKPLDVVARERLFGPLGMTRSDFARGGSVDDNGAVGYERRDGGLHPVVNAIAPGARFASGGAISTARDLSRFLAYWYSDARPGWAFRATAVSDGKHDTDALTVGGALPGFTHVILTDRGGAHRLVLLTNVTAEDPQALLTLARSVLGAFGAEVAPPAVRIVTVQSIEKYGPPPGPLGDVGMALMEAIASRDSATVAAWYSRHRPNPDQPVATLARSLAGFSRELDGFSIAGYLVRSDTELFLVARGAKGEVRFTFQAAADDPRRITSLSIDVVR